MNKKRKVSKSSKSSNEQQQTQNKKKKTKKKDKDDKKYNYPPEKKEKKKDGDNNTYTTVACGLNKHCTNEGMKDDLTTVSLFISKAANRASFVMTDLFLLRHQTTDDSVKNDIDTLLTKYDPSKDSFVYQCMINNSKFRQLVPHAFNQCDITDLPPSYGISKYLDFAAKSMTVNIKEKLKNWPIYQRRAVSTQIKQVFDINMKLKKDRDRLKRILNIVTQMINGEAPIDELKEYELELAEAIVVQHRDALGFGSYDDKIGEWIKYSKKRKRQRRKEGKRGSSIVCKPKADMSDEFTQKNAVKTIEYFIHCLGIQEQSEDKLFHIFPQWKHQHNHVTFGNKTLYFLLKRNGDQNDMHALVGYTGDSFCNHPQLRDLWLKYFPRITKYERSNEDLDMDFHCLARSDGLSISFVYRMTYHDTDDCDNERVISIPLRPVPAEETEECRTVLEFGEHEGETYRYVLENDRGYARWAARTVVEGGAGDQLQQFASYVMSDEMLYDDDVDGSSSEMDIDSLYNLEAMNAWYMDDDCKERIKNADEIVFTTARGRQFTLASLRGEIYMHTLSYHMLLLATPINQLTYISLSTNLKQANTFGCLIRVIPTC